MATNVQRYIWKEIEKLEQQKVQHHKNQGKTFLTNISYTQLKNNHFANGNFILDIFILLEHNLNALSVGRKLISQDDQQIIYMLWEKCVPSSFYQFICQTKNFMYINGLEVFHSKVTQIVTYYVKSDPKNIDPKK